MPRIQHQMVPARSTGAISRFSTPTPWNSNFSNTLDMWMAKLPQKGGTDPPSYAPVDQDWVPASPTLLETGCFQGRMHSTESSESNKPLVATRGFYWQLKQQRKYRLSSWINLLMLCQQHWLLRVLGKPATLLSASGWSIYLIINKRSDSNSFCFVGRWGFFISVIKSKQQQTFPYALFYCGAKIFLRIT